MTIRGRLRLRYGVLKLRALCWVLERLRKQGWLAEKRINPIIRQPHAMKKFFAIAAMAASIFLSGCDEPVPASKIPECLLNRASDDCFRVTVEKIVGVPVTTAWLGSYSTIEFSVDPWMWTVSSAKASFDMRVSTLIPAVFAFSQVNEVRVIGMATTSDIRGNRSAWKFEALTFTRANSDSIHWDKIAWSDLPKLADEFDADPSYYTSEK